MSGKERRPLGDLLIERGLITADQLGKALELSRAWGVRLGDVVTAKGWVRRADLYQTLADHFDSVYIDLFSDPPDPELFDPARANDYSERLVLPWAVVGGRTWVVAADPTDSVVAYARELAGDDVYLAFSSKNEIRWAIGLMAGQRFSDDAVYGLAHVLPEHSARHVFTRAQLGVLYGSLLAAGFLCIASPVPFLMTVNVALTLFLLCNFGFKLLLAWVGGDRKIDVKVTTEEVAALRDAELPVYTVLVPMYKEPDVLPILAAALRNLDYPLSKLDIKLVLEEDDTSTIHAARALRLEDIFEIVQVPTSIPKTKPKACNYALNFARGDLLTIFDAEDKPEPDQLKKVVAAFAKSHPRTACIQARLNYYNAEENWLTRM